MKDSQEPTLIFFRVPKTAGGTFYRVLTRQFAKRDILDIETLVPSRDRREPYKPEQYHYLVKQTLAELPAGDKSNKRLFIEAHLSYGLHEFFPQPFSYITFLRDPVKRVISHYLYRLRLVTRDDIRDRLLKLGFEDYVRSKEFNHLTDNVQTRMLCGDKGVPKDGELTWDDVKEAKRRLKQCSFVGITERFDESLLIAKRRFGWKDIYYYRLNVTHYHLKPDELPERAIELLKEKNKFDNEVYKFACELFDKEAYEYGNGLTRDVQRFRRHNIILGRLHLLGRLATIPPRVYVKKIRMALNSLGAIIRIREDSKSK